MNNNFLDQIEERTKKLTARMLEIAADNAETNLRVSRVLLTTHDIVAKETGEADPLRRSTLVKRLGEAQSNLVQIKAEILYSETGIDPR